ncbi:WD40/YVTN/BNR-like repeat-containing protein [Pseudomonas sp. NA-150]|uniref:WD40/YVTN/BNR-like repeat-containing protein n=1 Tax=Pseudomonas sp. NA-150 TaxID=3367525 RepID=UPI0037C8C6B0
MARRFIYKSLPLALLMLAAQLSTQAAGFPDVLAQPSVMSSQASHAVLLGVTRAGARLVAVGERGVVLLSDDNGLNWRQVQVPVSSTLTAVQFVDASQGWATGHSGVVLHSADGGQSWSLQLDGRKAAALELADAQAAAKATADDPALQHRLDNAQRLVTDGPDKPFLALNFSDAQHGIVVGAYGLAMHTEDGGQSWHSWMGRIPNEQGLHLYAVAQSSNVLYLAGEQGLLLRSQDGGTHFERLDSPYEGSYFTLALQADDALLVGGLRGKLFRSRDQGTRFEALANPMPISLGSVVRVGSRLIWVNQAGGLLQNIDSENLLHPLTAPAGAPLTAVAGAADGSLVGVGFGGVARLSIPSLFLSPSSPANAVAE